MTEEMIFGGVPHRQNIKERDGQHFALREMTASQETWVRIDLKEHEKRMRSLAEKISNLSDVTIVDIIANALHDQPLELIEATEAALEAEISKATEEGKKPVVKKQEGCLYLKIGTGKRFKKGATVWLRN